MKSWLRAWKKAWASRGAFSIGNRGGVGRIGNPSYKANRRRDLRFESLESRELLSIVAVVAKDPAAGEDLVGGQTDTGQFVVARDVVDSSSPAVTLQLGGTLFETSEVLAITPLPTASDR